MRRDGQHEEPARHIADVDQPRLGKARRRMCRQLVGSEPVRRHQKGRRLLQVRQEEVEDQYDALVAPDVPRVVPSPEDKAPGEPDEQAAGRDDRQQAAGQEPDEASTEPRVQRADHQGRRFPLTRLQQVDERHGWCVLDGGREALARSYPSKPHSSPG
ncbi:hypothetical protein VTO42DRAFT_7870 [Malbranchea cinnamomea]